jgi:hypothetical protein
MTDFAKRCELEAIKVEALKSLVPDTGSAGAKLDYEHLEKCAARIRALAKPDAERLPNWAKPLMRHVRNYCTTQCSPANPDLLRMLYAWEALTDEQRNEVQP